MAEFFKTSTLWVIDFRYDGSLRRWFRAFAPGTDVTARMTAELHELQGARAQLVGVREASVEEETAYLRGEEPKNVMCPTGRVSRAAPDDL